MDDKARIAALEAELAAIKSAASIGGGPATLNVVKKKVPVAKEAKDAKTTPTQRKKKVITVTYVANWGLITPGTAVRISDPKRPQFDWAGVYYGPTCFRRTLPDGKTVDYRSLNQFASAQRQALVDAKLIKSAAVDAWKTVEFQSNVNDEWVLFTSIRKAHQTPVANIVPPTPTAEPDQEEEDEEEHEEEKANSMESHPDDVDAPMDFASYIYNGTGFMLKVGTDEVYLPDTKTYVGTIDIDENKMTWKWSLFTYKSAKGYYKNARGDVVKVKDDIANYIGLFNPETKTIVERPEPADLNLPDLLAELAGLA